MFTLLTDRERRTKYQERVLILLSLTMWFENSIRFGSLTGGMGASLISIPFWAVIGGGLVFNVVLVLINFIKPDSNLGFTITEKGNARLLIGVVSKLFVPGAI